MFGGRVCIYIYICSPPPPMIYTVFLFEGKKCQTWGVTTYIYYYMRPNPFRGVFPLAGPRARRAAPAHRKSGHRGCTKPAALGATAAADQFVWGVRLIPKKKKVLSSWCSIFEATPRTKCCTGFPQKEDRSRFQGTSRHPRRQSFMPVPCAASSNMIHSCARGFIFSAPCNWRRLKPCRMPGTAPQGVLPACMAISRVGARIRAWRSVPNDRILLPLWEGPANPLLCFSKSANIGLGRNSTLRPEGSVLSSFWPPRLGGACNGSVYASAFAERQMYVIKNKLQVEAETALRVSPLVQKVNFAD